MTPRILYHLTGFRRCPEESDLPPRQIDLSHVPVHILQRIFHAGPANQLLEPRPLNREKAERLQAYVPDRIDPDECRWEFSGRWSDHPR